MSVNWGIRLYYVLVMVFLFLLNSLFLVPEFTILIGIVTFGIGWLFFWLIANLTVLLLFFAPSFLLGVSLLRFTIPICIVVYLAYLFYLPIFSEKEASKYITVHAEKPAEIGSLDFRSIEILWRPKGWKRNNCDSFCSQFLKSKKLDWVRIKSTRDKQAHTFTSAKYEKCNQNKKRINGCLTSEDGDFGEADLKLHITELKTHTENLFGMIPLFEVKEGKKIRLLKSDAGEEKVVYSDTLFRIKDISMPTFFILFGSHNDLESQIIFRGKSREVGNLNVSELVEKILLDDD